MDAGGSGGAIEATDAGIASPETALRPAMDPGRAPLRRLTDVEYENTVRDLLGVAALPAAVKLPNEPHGGDFDNDVASLSMSAARFDAYLRFGWLLADQVMADPMLRGRVVPCAPPSSGPPDACLLETVRSFGARAWRRPLAGDESKALTELGTQAITGGASFDDAVKQIVVALLTSESFLYRIEFDPPFNTRPHLVGPYEMASRLSYLLWGGMPDQRLFLLAEVDHLQYPATLQSEVERMLSDARADRFVRSFAGQWLQFATLADHEVTVEVVNGWGTTIKQPMIAEASLFTAEILLGDRDVRDLLTADVNFVNRALNVVYRFDGGGEESLVRIENTTDERIGYLGLAGFLTATSFPEQTSATRRGRFVLKQLLCGTAPAPAAGTPEWPQGPGGVVPDPRNARARYQEISTRVMCQPCHRETDVVGLGLENFDATGAYRTRYPDGAEIDAQGWLGDKSFRGLRELATLLAMDPRFVGCVEQKALSYALGRPLLDTDRGTLDTLKRPEGQTMRNLMARIVASDQFRWRRGEP